MRQAGLKPKPHSSGIYWTRAALPESSSKPAKSKKPKAKVDAPKYHKLDFNKNGRIEVWDILLHYSLILIFSLIVFRGIFWVLGEIAY
jgi:hypothetical protein